MARIIAAMPVQKPVRRVDVFPTGVAVRRRQCADKRLMVRIIAVRPAQKSGPVVRSTADGVLGVALVSVVAQSKPVLVQILLLVAEELIVPAQVLKLAAPYAAARLSVVVLIVELVCVIVNRYWIFIMQTLLLE